LNELQRSLAKSSGTLDLNQLNPAGNYHTICNVPKSNELHPGVVSKFAAQPGFGIFRDGSAWRFYKDPIELLIANDPDSLQQSISRIEQHVKHGGEAAGFLAYEAGYALEPRLHPLLARARGPLSYFGLYANCSVLQTTPFLEDHTNSVVQDPKLLIGYEEYSGKLAAIRQLIQDGEVYQINFTTGVCFQTAQSAWKLFGNLFSRHPVPYAAFLNTGVEQIVSLSPELFFQIERGRITVRPMKGTASRGLTLKDDIACAEALCASEKNRAENAMIVDLMRNDLGRICRTGTVKAPKLFGVERYPSLWQMTSDIEGELVKGWTIQSVIHALFPSGSVTGAPKIRAMEHIAHLEDSPRGVYTGAIGFFAPSRARFSVGIRTAVLRRRNGTMGVGSGITYDSSAPVEWEECGWKATFLTQEQPKFEILETLLWNSRFRFLQAHMTRMRNSAEYFGFYFPGNRIRKALRELAQQWKETPQRVRITLASDATFEISNSSLGAKRFGRVKISERRVSTQDRFLYHKTTHRGAYDQELAAARKANCDDALFFNEKDELTEGTIHNVFVVKNGVWRTPAVTCGLLPGTFRARILRKHSNAQEAILTMDDLTRADKIFLCNSVRGIFPVDLVLDKKSAQ
jgi:para-aminobenzoate synthetase / 4-amino-4-deoxychorismate lyase